MYPTPQFCQTFYKLAFFKFMKKLIIVIPLVLVCIACITSKKVNNQKLISEIKVQYPNYSIIANNDSSYFLLKNTNNIISGGFADIKIYDCEKSFIIFDNSNKFHNAVWISGDEVELKCNMGIEIRKKNSEIENNTGNVEIYIFNVKKKNLSKRNNLLKP